MKKLLLLLAAATAALSSCSHRDSIVNAETTRVQLRLNGDFEVQYSDMTRATSLEASAMTDLWIYDYDAASSELLQRIHLTEGFASPTISLFNGSHSLSIIASRGTTPSATDEAVEWQKPHDTFAAITDLTVDGTSVTKSVNLNRRVARVSLNILDLIPAEATTLEWVFSQWGTAIDPATTYAPSTAEYQYLTNMTPMRGMQNVSVSAYTIAPSASAWQTSLSIRVLDADNEPVAEATIPTISLLQNRTTTLKGNLFSSDGTLTIGLDDTWGDGIEQTF